MTQPTLKRKILDLLSNYQWWSMAEMVEELDQATSIDQRINEMKRDGIEFEQRHFGSNHWEWKLLTKWEDIDLKRCSLKAPEPVGPPPLQIEITL